MKTFKLQYLLHLEMGSRVYKDFLKDYYTEIGERTTEDLEILLKKHKKINWKNFLKGWVFQGNYTSVSYDDFSDPDCDTILSVDEN